MFSFKATFNSALKQLSSHWAQLSVVDVGGVLALSLSLSRSICPLVLSLSPFPTSPLYLFLSPLSFSIPPPPHSLHQIQAEKED